MPWLSSPHDGLYKRFFDDGQHKGDLGSFASTRPQGVEPFVVIPFVSHFWWLIFVVSYLGFILGFVPWFHTLVSEGRRFIPLKKTPKMRRVKLGAYDQRELHLPEWPTTGMAGKSHIGGSGDRFCHTGGWPYGQV
jgi:hypothetical protein